jgi:hypothetical protein
MRERQSQPLRELSMRAAMLLLLLQSDVPSPHDQARENACAHLVDDMDREVKRISLYSCNIGFEYGVQFERERKK